MDAHINEFVPETKPLWGSVLYPKIANLWKSGYGCDTTIICQDGSVKAPSILLSALSKKIHAVLLESKDKVLNFLNVDVKFWEDLLSWVYAGVLPHHMNDETALPHLFSTLLVAHSLGMCDILSLYKHLSQIGKPGVSVANIWDSFESDIKMEVQMQYINANSNDATLVCFSSAVLNDLKDCMQSVPLQNVKTCQVRHPGEAVEEVCINCDKKCESKMVQCLYCREVVQRKNGSNHMDEAHRFSGSIAWPFSCVLDVTLDKGIIKGGKTLIKQYNKQGVYQYKCNLCSLMTGNVVRFMEHYVVHGFFPKICTSCGDIFSNDRLKMEHFQYCNLRTTVSDNNRLEVELVQGMDTFGVEDNADNSLLDIPNMESFQEVTDQLVLPCFRKCCMACGDICVAKRVVCLYCNSITENDVSHMFSDHSGCKKAKLWAYTCDLERAEKSEEIIRKMHNSQDNEVFECRICHQNLDNKEKVFFHVRNIHKIPSLFHCSLCDSGFKSSALRSRHQHLCSGGTFVRCQRCQFYGTVEDLHHHKEEEHENLLVKRKRASTKSGKKLTSGQREKNNLPREQDGSLCFSCQFHCSAEKVKCVYCFKVVENNSLHMEEAHPYTPKTSPWVYTCKYLARQVIKPREWVLFVKEPVDPSDKTVFFYRCTKCNKTTLNLQKAIKHVKSAHHGYVKVCKFCESGFASFVHHKDHQHFCGGGELISCNMCNRNVGCFRSLYDHQTKWHTEVEKRTLKGKPVDVTSDEESFDEVEPDENSLDEHEQTAVESADEGHHGKMIYISGRSGCCNCASECTAVKVRCMYCGKIVENNSTHMKVNHPYTPENSVWAFTCKFQPEASAPIKDWVVSVKEPVDEVDVKDNVTVQNRHKGFQYKCVKCNTVFTSVLGVVQHMEEMHNILAIVCEICETGFAKYDQMLDHFHFCSGGKPLTCQVCNLYLGSYNLHLHHMSIEHPDYHELSENSLQTAVLYPSNAKSTERKSVCFTCGEKCTAALVKCMYCYKIVENNASHMDKSHVFTPKSCVWVYQCKFLNNAEDSQKWMASSKELVAPEGKLEYQHMCIGQHRCAYCDICLADLDSMLVHIKTDHGISHPLKICGICDAVFLKFSFWKDHFHFCCGGDLLMCDTCGKEIGGYKALSDHNCPGLVHNFEYNAKTELSSEENNADPGNFDKEITDVRSVELDTLDIENMQNIFPNDNYSASDKPQEVGSKRKAIVSDVEVKKRKINDKFKESKLDVQKATDTTKADLEIPKGIELHCIECDFKTPYINDMNSHNIRIHGYEQGEVGQICHFCFRIFKSRSNREKHEQHEHLSDQRVFCEKCGRDFEILLQKEIHIKYFHKDD